jgi:hypothetical protein
MTEIQVCFIRPTRRSPYLILRHLKKKKGPWRLQYLENNVLQLCRKFQQKTSMLMERDILHKHEIENRSKKSFIMFILHHLSFLKFSSIFDWNMTFCVTRIFWPHATTFIRKKNNTTICIWGRCVNQNTKVCNCMIW